MNEQPGIPAVAVPSSGQTAPVPATQTVAPAPQVGQIGTAVPEPSTPMEQQMEHPVPGPALQAQIRAQAEPRQEGDPHYWYSYAGGGHKISMGAPSLAELMADISAFFGPEAGDIIVAKLSDLALGTSVLAAGLASQADSPPMPAGGFKPCRKCGGPLDKFVPGGTSSRTGKPYNSFYGCSNPNCR